MPKALARKTKRIIPITTDWPRSPNAIVVDDNSSYVYKDRRVVELLYEFLKESGVPLRYTEGSMPNDVPDDLAMDESANYYHGIRYKRLSTGVNVLGGLGRLANKLNHSGSIHIRHAE